MSASAATTKPVTPPNKKFRTLFAGLMIIAGAAVIFFSLYSLPPRFDRGPHREAGQVLAQEALKMLQPGGRVILITRDTAMFKAPAFEAQAEGFRKTLKKARVSIATTRLLKV